MTRGGRLVLYERNELVIASTHGRYDLNRRFRVSEIGDPDMEAAVRLLKASQVGMR